METKYQPGAVEKKWYQIWEERGYFHQEAQPGKKAFSIVMPPPNVTGQLHLGHAMDNTLQDILVRYKRMQGYNTVWIPGTDHAGIATQAKVEEELKATEGLSRYDLGRRPSWSVSGAGRNAIIAGSPASSGFWAAAVTGSGSALPWMKAVL